MSHNERVNSDSEPHPIAWLFQLGDVNETSYPKFILEVGALAMGSSTYEWMLRHLVKPGTSYMLDAGRAQLRCACRLARP